MSAAQSEGEAVSGDRAARVLVGLVAAPAWTCGPGWHVAIDGVRP